MLWMVKQKKICEKDYPKFQLSMRIIMEDIEYFSSTFWFFII